ncbi:MAG: 3-phosphoshikimate 1-carboxyvinyltransferase [Acholeplasmataceae bacterium]|jgi:3-phosphoshikimate 1-carboxyvinyltransferase|nr:3-phosphoshikimate 1-carboxyvinyltransferase [Acholeplasmataceae bacterium]
MRIHITPKALTGSIEVISSKSLSHRYVIAAGLAKGISTVSQVLDSDDLTATKKALENLGVTFKDQQIKGTDIKLKNHEFDCLESGSTLRFMIPISLLQSEKVIFKGRGKLPDRPLDVYESIFKQKNIEYRYVSDRKLPLEIKGPLKAGYYQVLGNVSSQFFTGLLFALPLLKQDSVIEHVTPLESKGYIDLTLDVLEQFGIHVKYEHPYFHVKGNQTYKTGHYIVEGDFSQAAFWMVAGLIGQSINLTNLNPLSKQGDKKIVDIITEMKGKIKYYKKDSHFLVTPTQTKGTVIDLSQIPDLGPILMVLAALSKGTTTFKHASRLRIKESDRLDAMYHTLKKFGVDIDISDDEAVIRGKDVLKGNQTFDSYGDHRIAMAIAIAAIRADGEVIIENAEVISKSYPTFYEIYKSLGGIIHES